MVSEQKATILTEEMVEAACKAHAPQFERMDPEIQKYARIQMRAALKAAISQPAEAGAVDVEALTDRVANAKLGEGSSVRCEGPTDFEKDQARAWVRRVLKALGASSPAPAETGEPAVKAGDLLKALEWAYPLAVQYQEYWAGERAKAGHRGLGTKRSTLYDSEVADQEFALATLTEARVRSALVHASAKERPCTCHPDDNPPSPCAEQYALGDCRRASKAEG